MTTIYPPEWTRADIAAETGREHDDYSWGIVDTMPRFDGRICRTEYYSVLTCTRPAGHTGRHAASNSKVIVAVWGGGFDS